MRTRTVRTVALACLLALLGCAGEEIPRVERLIDPYPAPWEIDFAGLTGSRRGERVEATIRFESPVDTLVVDLACRLTPACEMVSGRFRAVDVGARVEGSVRPLSLTFQGGQGGRPAFGARLELVSEAGTRLYRVTLPPTELSPAR
ncbi:MAG: hypothetical protein GF346_11420 [Candidatus Eisenbacteria bacterium]|nr:hypothetical protein [Candidatus Latescibacterota bacterium]MBD3303045.1 hypothetical protein [Candidatus Eisenbacteria bacterium]